MHTSRSALDGSPPAEVSAGCWGKGKAVILVVALIAASIAFNPGVASAYDCSGTTWADGESWKDNQWWGDGCPDDRGEMVRAIQLIVNYTSTGQGCWTGDDDGIWGPQTKTGVICYQSWKGLTADGIVGPNTWGQRARSPYTGLMSQLRYYGPVGGVLVYDLDWVTDQFHYRTSDGHWFVRNICDQGYNFSEMKASGPDVGCVP